MSDTTTTTKHELTDEEKRKRLDDHYEAIKEKETEVAELEHYVIDLTYQLKQAKKRFDGAVSELRYLISRDPLYVPPVVDDPQMKLEFDEEYDKRLQAPITEALSLSEKQLEKLESAGVKTVGDFENLRGGQNKDYPRGLSDVKGVGQATIDKWENDIVAFLQVNVPKQEEQPEESAA